MCLAKQPIKNVLLLSLCNYYRLVHANCKRFSTCNGYLEVKSEDQNLVFSQTHCVTVWTSEHSIFDCTHMSSVELSVVGIPDPVTQRQTSEVL